MDDVDVDVDVDADVGVHLSVGWILCAYQRPLAVAFYCNQFDFT